jgi:hypothetical protein
LLSIESQIEHIFYDTGSNQMKIFDNDKLLSELDRIAKTIETYIGKLEKIGDYELSTIQVTSGVKAGILVIGVEGGIVLTYTKNKTL